MPVKASKVSQAFGLVLRDTRIAKGFSQTELAERAAVDRTFISQMERGTHQASLTTLCKLARALGVMPSALMSRVERLLR
jgi:XRE family transcriptional regulator, regulator of sulfur utilization